MKYTIDRSGLPSRDMSRRLDKGLMGEIGSLAVMNVLSEVAQAVVAYDEVRTDYDEDEDPGWDIVTGEDELEKWATDPPNPRVPPTSANTVSVKASLIPSVDNDDIDVAIEERDFKILRYSNTIEEDLSADVTTQVYFPHQRDNPGSLNIDSGYVEDCIETVGDPSKDLDEVGGQIDNVLDELDVIGRDGENRYSWCYLVGYASREDIIEWSRALHRGRRWSYGGKTYWRASLHELGRSFDWVE